MFVVSLFLALHAEVHQVALLLIARALRADEDPEVPVHERLVAAAAKHESLRQQLRLVLGGLVVGGDAVPRELVQMGAVLLEAPLAQDEVLAGLAVESEGARLDGAVAGIAGEPLVKLIS